MNCSTIKQTRHANGWHIVCASSSDLAMQLCVLIDRVFMWVRRQIFLNQDCTHMKFRLNDKVKNIQLTGSSSNFFFLFHSLFHIETYCWTSATSRFDLLCCACNSIRFACTFGKCIVIQIYTATLNHSHTQIMALEYAIYDLQMCT